MPVESDIDRAVFVEDFGDTVLWWRTGVPQSPFLAIFNRPSVSVELDPEAAGTFNRIATLSCPESVLPFAAAEDDPVEVAGEPFKCSAIRPDGTGWCVVDLKRG